ncbi:Suppressor of cytokine signaling 2, partial [Bulinus truncatus]
MPPSCPSDLLIELSVQSFHTNRPRHIKSCNSSPSSEISRGSQNRAIFKLNSDLLGHFGCRRTSSENSFVLPIQQDFILQHGMALPENRFVDDDENTNDSGFGSAGYSVYKPRYDCNNELEKLENNVEELSACCFYFGPVNSQEARDILCKKPVGTFLLRDSSDSKYLYSLSLKTERGATSVRILYNKGLFQFDSDEKIRNKLPCFESVLALVDFHVMITQTGNNKCWRWEENSGKKSMKVSLKNPLKCSVPSLAHLARIKINQCLEDVYMPHLSVDKLSLSSQLKDYLKSYPYR